MRSKKRFSICIGFNSSSDVDYTPSDVDEAAIHGHDLALTVRELGCKVKPKNTIYTVSPTKFAMTYELDITPNILYVDL